VALLDFIESLPQGLETRTGERGVNLSGGQKQRIGIARALVAHPKLLIMDEATNALDESTQSSVVKSIRELNKESTILTVTHRLSTIVDADLIIYISNGRMSHSKFLNLLLRLALRALNKFN
jgi:ATP-binding cassette subfamily B protein